MQPNKISNMYCLHGFKEMTKCSINKESGYLHDSCANKNPYPHDRHADKNIPLHDRDIQWLNLKIN